MQWRGRHLRLLLEEPPVPPRMREHCPPGSVVLEVPCPPPWKHQRWGLRETRLLQGPWGARQCGGTTRDGTCVHRARHRRAYGRPQAGRDMLGILHRPNSPATLEAVWLRPVPMYGLGVVVLGEQYPRSHMRLLAAPQCGGEVLPLSLGHGGYGAGGISSPHLSPRWGRW